jgi:hypothetical protein
MRTPFVTAKCGGLGPISEYWHVAADRSNSGNTGNTGKIRAESGFGRLLLADDASFGNDD